jgi:protein-tyrosine phosphatase
VQNPTDVRSILLVCLGNICRSPVAEGLLRAHAEAAGLKLMIDSAGTAGYHVGAPPDQRACRVARSHGVPIDALRARQVQARDFDRFDLILAADRQNLLDLERMRPPGARAALSLLLAYAGDAEDAEVPDPYYGRQEAFEHVHRLLDGACRAITARLRGVAECGDWFACGAFDSPW